MEPNTGQKQDCWSVATFILCKGMCMPYFIPSLKATLQGKGFSSSRWRAGSLGRESQLLKASQRPWCGHCWDVILGAPSVSTSLRSFLPAQLSTVVCWTLDFACSREAGITRKAAGICCNCKLQMQCKSGVNCSPNFKKDILIRVWVTDAQLFCYSLYFPPPTYSFLPKLLMDSKLDSWVRGWPLSINPGENLHVWFNTYKQSLFWC